MRSISFLASGSLFGSMTTRSALCGWLSTACAPSPIRPALRWKRSLSCSCFFSITFSLGAFLLFGCAEFWGEKLRCSLQPLHELCWRDGKVTDVLCGQRRGRQTTYIYIYIHSMAQMDVHNIRGFVVKIVSLSAQHLWFYHSGFSSHYGLFVGRWSSIHLSGIYMPTTVCSDFYTYLYIHIYTYNIHIYIYIYI